MTVLVAPCSHAAAKYAVTKWHYSRQLPNQKLVKFGVWEDQRFLGAVIFGDGANAGMFKPYGLDYSEGCELVRVALRDHVVAVSSIVSKALRLLIVGSPGLRLVISFADPEYGHTGIIYQAGNWIYTGMTLSSDEYMVNGVRMHGRALRSTRSTHARGGIPARNVLEWTRQALDPSAYRLTGSSKHRYLYPLDRQMRRRLQPLALPYPRGSSLEGETSNLRLGRPGSTPGNRSK